MEAIRRHERQTPPFMIVFINSICNLTCEHCFYWQNLNQRNDLSFEEFEKLSRELGSFENLNLSGGEPFIRNEFAEICQLFISTTKSRTSMCQLTDISRIERTRHSERF